MKKTHNRFAALLLCAALALNLAGCTTGTASPTSTAASQAQSSTVATTEAANDAITLTDQAGRSVTLQQPADKIVSCYYITTYAAMALGVEDRIVGLEKKADTRNLYHLAAPQLLEKAQVGTMKELSVETVAALEPDLVVMPLALQDYAETLTALDIPVLLVSPESQQDLQQMLTLMGAATGTEDAAQALNDYYDATYADLAARLAGADTPSVYMAGNGSYLTVATDAMYQADLAVRAGGRNAAEGLEGSSRAEVSYESLLAMNPDYIILPSGADYAVADVTVDAQLAGLTAVQNGTVYRMPGGLDEWDSPIPSGVIGALWLASKLHPDLYGEEEFTAAATAFYEEFYQFTPDAALLAG